MSMVGSGSEDYLQAFMSGFEFVLMAIRGRLADESIPEEDRERLEVFVADYWRIAQAFHERQPPRGSVRIGAPRPFHVEMASLPSN